MSNSLTGGCPKVGIMSEVTESKEYKDLMEKFDSSVKKSEENENYIKTLKNSVDEIKSDRSALKDKLKEIENIKTTDGATVDELKKLLIETNQKMEDSEKARTKDRVMSKVRQKALESGFVLDKDGSINSKLLEAHIDISKLTEDDGGKIFGLDSIFENVKKESPYMFTSKKAVSNGLNPDPKTVNGRDLSSEAFAKASLKERIAIVKARGEEFTKDNNGMLSGMSGTSALVNNESGDSKT